MTNLYNLVYASTGNEQHDLIIWGAANEYARIVRACFATDPPLSEPEKSYLDSYVNFSEIAVDRALTADETSFKVNETVIGFMCSKSVELSASIQSDRDNGTTYLVTHSLEKNADGIYQHTWKCTCPDWQYRGGLNGTQCKHIRKAAAMPNSCSWSSLETGEKPLPFKDTTIAELYRKELDAWIRAPIGEIPKPPKNEAGAEVFCCPRCYKKFGEKVPVYTFSLRRSI